MPHRCNLIPAQFNALLEEENHQDAVPPPQGKTACCGQSGQTAPPLAPGRCGSFHKDVKNGKKTPKSR